MLQKGKKTLSKEIKDRNLPILIGIKEKKTYIEIVILNFLEKTMVARFPLKSTDNHSYCN